MSKPKFGYWNIRARGESIRWVLAYCGVDYEEKEYSEENPAEWFSKDKPAIGMEFASLPYWIEGDLKLMGVNAILRHIARLNKLDGNDEKEIATLDMLSIFFGVIREKHISLCYRHNDREFGKKRCDYEKDFLMHRLPDFSSYLGEKQFLIGDRISYADFVFYEVLYTHKLFIPKCELQKRHANLADYMKRIESIPSIAKYIEEKSKKRSVYASTAQWQGPPPDYITLPDSDIPTRKNSEYTPDTDRAGDFMS